VLADGCVVISGAAFTVRDCCADAGPLQPPLIVKIMFAVPGPVAVTIPEVGSTVATFVLSLLHVPVPPDCTCPLAVYRAVAPTQSGLVPVTDATDELGSTKIDVDLDTVPPQPPVMV